MCILQSVLRCVPIHPWGFTTVCAGPSRAATRTTESSSIAAIKRSLPCSIRAPHQEMSRKHRTHAAPVELMGRWDETRTVTWARHRSRTNTMEASSPSVTR